MIEIYKSYYYGSIVTEKSIKCKPYKKFKK